MNKISISNSELEIMKLLWAKAPQTSPELVSILKQRCSWEETTITTLLARLVKKGAVIQSGQRRSYLYMPRISREEYRIEASHHLLEHAFDNNPGALMNFFAKRSKLTEAEITELKKLLEETIQHG